MPITVYSGSHCHACHKVKEFLSRSGREFVVKDVDEDPEAFNDLMALGIMTLPVTVVGDTIVRGWDEKKLREVIG
jgi:glutaredoxin